MLDALRGAWNLAFLAGILTGGVLSAAVIGVPAPGISDATRTALATLGIHDISGLVPATLISWDTLMTWRGAFVIIGGGFAIGFGTAWAGGCSSGHAVLVQGEIVSLRCVQCVRFQGCVLCTGA